MVKSRSSEAYPGQRNREKSKLFSPFRYPCVEDAVKRKFYALFEHRCFRCGRPERPEMLAGEPPILCMDHHVPMALGGRLVPGNLVALCRRCNEEKLDRDPSAFYSEEQLRLLQPILDRQAALFDFKFDREAFEHRPLDYLVSLGVAVELAEQLLSDPDHPDYIFVPGRGEGAMTISIGVGPSGLC